MHTVKFYRTHEGTYRARCTCAWSMEGALIECQTRAATHDLDEIEPAREPHIVTDDDFISGLA